MHILCFYFFLPLFFFNVKHFYIRLYEIYYINKLSLHLYIYIYIYIYIIQANININVIIHTTDASLEQNKLQTTNHIRSQCLRNTPPHFLFETDIISLTLMLCSGHFVPEMILFFPTNAS